MTESEPQIELDELSVETEAAIKPKRPLWVRLLKWAGVLSLVGILVTAGLIFWAIMHYGRGLPDYRQLSAYEPPVMTRIHAGDGSLLREYARTPRLFVPINAVPDRLKQAFISAEDKNFYEHFGLDMVGIGKAMILNVGKAVKGQRLIGASTITQQVARNFLLTLDRRLDRKIKEMILTVRMERTFTKEQILELYLNEINLGNRSFGVAAAALNYFNKSLDELTNAEMAFLAALPKAPHNYHPVRKKARAVARRNWVLSRMHILGYITDAEYAEALKEDLVMIPRSGDARFKADYFEESVRRQLLNQYGEETLYAGGLSVRTTLEPRLQAFAERALRDGLVAYDRRHGWRGPLGRMSVQGNWSARLIEDKRPLGDPRWQLGLVIELRKEGAIIGLSDGSFGFITMAELAWAKAWRTGERVGPAVSDVSEVLTIGDLIATETLSGAQLVSLDGFVDDMGDPLTTFAQYKLRQIPAIEGALVAMDPHTGRVLAMVGGFDFNLSEFNRAVQAKRQPGSAFKPFVYAAALDEGFTPSSLILDAPFVMDQGDGQGKWKPRNSSNKFYGPSTLRLGIEKSRNLMTVRLAQNIGMSKVRDYARNFKIYENMQPTLAMSLGAGEVSPLNLTAAYSMLVNGGKEITPSLIDRIQDRRGKTVYRHDKRDCFACTATWQEGDDAIINEPFIPDERKTVLDPRTAYQMVSMLEGVVERGTGRRISVLNRPLAGKTGTTNDSTDAWFVGFSPDLTVGVFTGFDQRRSLGRFEEGSTIASPIFRDFMKEALRSADKIPFRIPSGLRLVRISAKTGLPAQRGDKDIILEAFIPGTEPKPGQLTILDGSLPVGKTKGTVRKGSGGIY